MTTTEITEDTGWKGLGTRRGVLGECTRTRVAPLLWALGLVGIVIGFLVGDGFSQTAAGAESPGAEDRYLAVILQIEGARKQSEAGARDVALGQLGEVVVALEKVRTEYPEWNVGMVDYRIGQTKREIERLRNALVDPSVPAEKEPVVDSAGSDTTGSGDPMAGFTGDSEPSLFPLPESLPNGIRVLILADSMGMGGFGEQLDSCFRAMPGVVAVHTIMACGTNPLTWMKSAPYANATTRCGFWTITSVPGVSAPRVFRDTYGVPKGHKPGRHRIPKIEDLVDRIRPQIVVCQNGNNFYSSFRDRKTIAADSHGPMIRAHVAPLVKWLADNGSSIRKFYWVTPPQCGIVTPEIQQFVFDAIAEESAGIGTLIDSREVTHYPYKVQAPDREHFWGNESLAWGQEIFDAITRDLEAHPLESVLALTARKGRNVEPESGDPVRDDAGVPLRLRVLGVHGTPVPSLQNFAPYGEMLVGYLYDVEAVLEGTYEGDRLLVFHPAYIGKELQELPDMEAAKSHEFSLLPLDEKSPWGTVGQADASGRFDLVPYMLVSDLARHPDFKVNDECGEP